MQRNLKILTLALFTVLLGTSVALVLERSVRMTYNASQYVKVQTAMYTLWGSQAVVRFLEPVAVVAALALLVSMRKQRGFLLVAAATVALLVAYPVVFYWRVSPAFAAFHDSATIGVIVPNWQFWRSEWEAGQLIRSGLHLVAFVLLATGLSANAKKK